MNTYDNTLYVLTQGAYISKDGERVAVRVENETRLAVPIHTLGGIVTFGQVSASPFLMGMAVESGVCMSFLTEQGRFLARVEGPVSGNVLLRKRQYRESDSHPAATRLAAAFIAGKFANLRVVLERHKRDNIAVSPKLIRVSSDLAAMTRKLVDIVTGKTNEFDLDQVRGIEGTGSALYFSVFDELITKQKEAFFFQTRSRRPPRDNVNALLSFLYTLLAHDVRGALETVGLDPQVGFLHRDRPGRPGLALDMMEELRPILADRLVISLVNRKQVSSKGFIRNDNGSIEMNEKTKREVLNAYQERKREEIFHPFLEKKVPWGLVPHIQARLLARFLRDELDGYPAFVWR